MFVSDEEGVQVTELQVDELKPCAQLRHGQTAVNQNLRGGLARLRLNQSGIASATTA